MPALPSLPLDPRQAFAVWRDVQGREARAVVVSGAPGPARRLREGLLAGGGEPALVRGASGSALGAEDLEDAGVLVYVLEGGQLSPADEEALRLAARLGVPIVGLAVGATPPVRLPYTLSTDVVVAAGEGELPLFRLGERIAAKQRAHAPDLARRLPALRRAVAEQIVESVTRSNALYSAAFFLPGVDFAVLTVRQIRMVLQLAVVYDHELDRSRMPELVAAVGAGLGFRGAARFLAAHAPVPKIFVRVGIAAAGTRALGEAAIRYFESRGVDAVRSRT